jgi:uncharacterized phage protein gp47/JayE
MSIEYKYEDIAQDLKLQFQKDFSQSNPFLPNSFLGSLLNTFAFGLYDLNLKMRYLLKQTFANTADIKYLRLQAQNRIEELEPTYASGLVTVYGDEGTIISQGDEFNVKNGDLIFKAEDNATISNSLITKLESLTSKETLAILSFTDYHHLINDQIISISNADNVEFNGDWKIRVIDNKTVSFNIDSASDLNEDIATSEITISSNMTLVSLKCSTIGEIGNIQPYTPLESNNVNIEVVSVNYNGFSGGRDEESTQDYRERFLKFLRLPQAYFNASNLESLILEKFPKVTRVYINDNAPLPNLVTFYVVNDNVTDLTVDSATINEIRDFLETYRPINVSIDALKVENPKQQEVSIIIDKLSPNASSFKKLVEEDIKEYLKSVKVGGRLDISKLQGFIYNIRDFKNGYNVEDFELTQPLQDVQLEEDSLIIGKITIN